MRWFRDTIRQSTGLALIALAMNLVLSFGHIHALEGPASEHAIVAMAASIPSADDAQKTSHPHDGHPDYLCPICMAASTLANALTSAPPALPLERGNVIADRKIEDVLAAVERSRGAFQPRGPPIS
jgi:hypothetical protein